MRFSVRLLATIVGVLASAVGCSRKSAEPSAGASAKATATAAAASAAASGSDKPTEPNLLAIPAASVELVVNPTHMPAYTGPVGSIEGTVLIDGPDAPNEDIDVHGCPAALDTYGKMFRTGPARPDGLHPLADALVVVKDYQGFVPEKNEAQRVTITPNCAYPLRTIALTFGQRLEVANDSALPFAPFLEGMFMPAVMIAPPRQAGEPVKIYPPRADYYGLRDRLQPYVHGDVYVLRQPLHAVSDLTGHFRIDGVPVGKVKIGARLAAIQSQDAKQVDVRENVVENVELVLKYARKPPPRPGQRPARSLPPND